jgi:hypothetical protein
MRKARGNYGQPHRVSGAPLVFALAVLAWACGKPAGAGNSAYTPLFASAVEAAKSHPPGTIAAAFAEAGSAKDLEEAAVRWAAFLKRYPPDMETEDAAQKRYVDAAGYELVRIYYLLGKKQEGDRLFQAMDPLDVR